MKNLQAFKQIEKALKEEGLLDNVTKDALKIIKKSLGKIIDEVTYSSSSSGILNGASMMPHPKELKSVQGLFIAIYSDGACRGNPGPGSWGMVAQNELGDKVFESTGVELKTTNNKMELQGAMDGLKQLIDWVKSHGDYNSNSAIFLFSDSRYVVDGITKWVAGWKKRGWKKSDGKPPENLDLWQQFSLLAEQFQNCKYIWVKGHNGHPQNEYCDMLANKALDEAGY